jgi:hypothetical protein
MKKSKILELALMTSVYTSALNDMQDMTTYNPKPRGSRHQSTLNKKQSSKRSSKNKKAKQSRKRNRK